MSLSSPRAFALNPLVSGLDSPPIPEAKAWLAAYAGGAGPVIDLSQAVPGTPPPAEMLAALAAAAGSAEATRYGPILGDAALREGYAAEASALYRASIRPPEVAMTAGCNLAFIAAMLVLARAGENVILPAPWYFNHHMSLTMLGISPRALPCRAEAGFVPDVAEAEALIDAATRAIVLVTPNNPTGAIYPPAVIEAFANLARRHRIALVLDETYRDFAPEGAPPHPLFSDADWGDVLVSLYSFSKAYAIPGHRLGAVIAAEPVIGEIAKVLDNLQICPARPAQAAVAWAIEGIRPWRRAQRDLLIERAAVTRAAFQALPGWRLDSIGAYFAFAAHPEPGRPAAEVARRLAVEHGVLALPGTYFGPGLESHLRLAFANVGAERLAELPARLGRI